jgi:hypothetical protein
MNPRQPEPTTKAESATFELPAAPEYDTAPLPQVVPGPARRRPVLMLATVTLLLAWAAIASLGLVVERAGHHRDAAKIAEQSATIDRQQKELANLRAEKVALQAKLREAEKKLPSPAARQAIKACAATVKQVDKLFPFDQLPAIARNGVILTGASACAQLASFFP